MCGRGFVVRMRGITNSQGHAPGADCCILSQTHEGRSPSCGVPCFYYYILLFVWCSLGGFISPTNTQGAHLGQIGWSAHEGRSPSFLFGAAF